MGERVLSELLTPHTSGSVEEDVDKETGLDVRKTNSAEKRRKEGPGTRVSKVSDLQQIC